MQTQSPQEHPTIISGSLLKPQGTQLTASRSPETRMGRGSLGPCCLCFQELCPLGRERAEGRGFSLLNCSLRMMGSQLLPRIRSSGGGVSPFPGLQLLRVTQNQARGCTRDVPMDPKSHTRDKGIQQALTSQPNARTLHQKEKDGPKALLRQDDYSILRQHCYLPPPLWGL